MEKELRMAVETAPPGPEEDWVSPAPPERPVIHAGCELFACRECRTKTEWPHQIGCGRKWDTQPGCGDCRYWSVKKEKCDHPARRRVGGRA